MVSTPKAPDPYATAAAQTASNQQTANYQQGLNMVNQVTPNGTLTYSGTNNGQPGSVTATTSLSPEQQQIQNNYTTGQIKEGTIANQQLDRVGNILGTPFNLDTEAGKYTDALQRSRLDPLWAQNEEQFNQNMANRGINPASQAYQMSRSQFDQSKNDAYNQMYLNDQAQANQAALANRNQPINEISALMSGSQVSQPSFTNTPTTQVAGTNIAGLINSNYQNQVSGYNAQMGGLFGLGGALGAAAITKSDRRLKTDIQHVATHPNGLPIYRYRFRDKAEHEYGFMAQDVQKFRPEAVHDINGALHVDYALASR